VARNPIPSELRKLAPPGPRSELAFVALIGVGVPLAYSLVLATQARNGPAGMATAVLRNTVPAALLGIVAWYLARFIARRSSPRAIAGHLFVAVTFGFVWALATFSGFGLWPDARGWSDFVRYSLWWFVLFGMLLYGVIAGAAHASIAKEALYTQRELALRAESAAILAQLEALRARLDPHFLFNALHSLAILAREDPKIASKGLTDLAQLLRYVLSAGRGAGRDVALDEELAFIQDYLALERLRLGDRLEAVLDIEEEARECGLPAFLLQPLVENAILHAIAPRSQGGCVRISARVEGLQLWLEVADDGDGVATPNRLDGGNSSGSGLGLRLVRQLLQVRYGDAANCEIITNQPRGLIARIRMPAAPPNPASDRAQRISLRDNRPHVESPAVS
jgi:signal transduction histidine kinase